MKIRKFKKADWKLIWSIIKPVFRGGETYPYAPNISEKDAYTTWIEAPQETFICIDEDNEILGTYYIKANQAELGSHVCNCGYIVAESARGKGIATKLCEHSQQIAKDLGFRAMQYNLVVTSNTGAIHLWEKMGFETVGTLPNAFKSKSLGYVDALVMYKELVK
jgi:RimJ/RimL family protein N-acetyltransferase